MQVSGTPVDLLSLIPTDVRWIAAGLIAVAALVFGWWQLRRGARALIRIIKRNSIEDNLTIIAAAIATLVAGQGMWQFVERTIDVHWTLRLLGFAFLEIAVVTSAVRARRNMRENFSAGIDGIAVWVITCLSAFLAAMEAHSVPEAIFRLAAPLVAAWLWERGMAIERHRIRGTSGINWRITPERIAVRLGLAEASDRTAGDVDRQRRISRVSLAVLKVDDAQGGRPRKQQRALAAFRRRIAQAVEHAGLATDPEAQAALLAQIDTLRSADALVKREAIAAWANPVTQEAKAQADAAMEELVRLDASEATQRALDNAALTLMALTERVTSDQVNDRVTQPVTETLTQAAVPVPRRAAPVTSTVTASLTPSVTVERVNSDVTFDVTDEAWFDIQRMLTEASSVTPMLTRPVTSNGVTEEVTDAADEASKTKVMRAFWESEVAQKRHPRPIDLARHAGADRSLASRLLNEWVEELSGWDKRRAKAALRGKASA